MHLRLILVAAMFSATVSCPSLAGEKFERVLAAFNTASSISRDSLAGEHAWAGYCLKSSDEVDDALFSYRQSSDPVMGLTLKVLELQIEGSSNYFVRMDETAIKKEIDGLDSSSWLDGSFTGDELLSRVHWRFQTMMRIVEAKNGSAPYFVALRQCRSIDGRQCNGSGSTPFITFEACYYYSQKF